MSPPRVSLVALAATLSLMAGGCAAGKQLAFHTVESAPPAERLLARRCQGCHASPNPAAMTRAQWLGALVRMQRRITLPAAEWDTLAALGAYTADEGGRVDGR